MTRAEPDAIEGDIIEKKLQSLLRGAFLFEESILIMHTNAEDWHNKTGVGIGSGGGWGLVRSKRG